MHRLSATALRVPGSGIREIVHLATRRGGDTARLEIGEPNFATPPHIVEAAHRAAVAGTGYTPSAGTGELRDAVRARLQRDYRHDVDTSRIIACQGAVQGLAAVMAAVVGPGDEVLVPDPAWPNYEMQALLLGARAVHYPLEPERGFLPDLDVLAGLFTERTRALVLNSPSNPTGVALPADVVERIVELARSRGVLVISDEVYDQIIFEGRAPAASALAPEDVAAVFSLSKTYAMTGWRVGYVVAPAWLAPTVARLQEPLLSSLPTVTQAAAVEALTGSQECVGLMCDAYRTRRDLVVSLFSDHGIECVRPNGAFYVMVPLAEGSDSRMAAIELVGEGVSTAPGAAFGDTAGSHLRLSLASSETTLRTGVARILSWYGRTGGFAAAVTAGVA